MSKITGIFVCFAFVVICDSNIIQTTKVPYQQPNQVNWCDPALMGANQRHIACKNDGKFASNCLRPIALEMTDKLRAEIVYIHNDFRNKVAGGVYPGKPLPAAVRMQTFEWDTQMEFLASLNCKSCKYAHDSIDDIRTPSYFNVGQSLSLVSVRESQLVGTFNATLFIKDRIDGWSGEITMIKPEVLSYPNEKTDPIADSYGHAAVMMNDGVSKVGCAACKFQDNFQTEIAHFYVVCNYAGAYGGARFYEMGPVTSKCTTGKNPQFPNLCHVNENKL